MSGTVGVHLVVAVVVAATNVAVGDFFCVAVVGIGADSAAPAVPAVSNTGVGVDVLTLVTVVVVSVPAGTVVAGVVVGIPAVAFVTVTVVTVAADTFTAVVVAPSTNAICCAFVQIPCTFNSSSYTVALNCAPSPPQMCRAYRPTAS